MTDSPRFPVEVLMSGDHLALNFLNTKAMIDGSLIDYFHTDEDVLAWLRQQGINEDDTGTPCDEPGVLLQEARQLRQVIGKLVTEKKNDCLNDVSALQTFLLEGISWTGLVEQDSGDWSLIKHYGRQSPKQILAPISEAAAHLVAEVDFSKVKQCEHSDCILWFFDKTKSHRRRWCSMKLCGNRHKVAKFRQKQKL
ncbi:CGNR zinc finger [Vibrio aerogenes CECT 7868]|uniref:CGNR zinc finger n=1 Tax=Vibrio aerogenes CECT 7868 TaxID=1216006 RepID=A0A1M5Y2X6_9VIBR|nr:CGNR zinc finger domain-containing protein [Vibrio aerogenes]SHI06421.1 CGNR zinc finger [Vibrio aerogenes CECT 7868]